MENGENFSLPDEVGQSPEITEGDGNELGGDKFSNTDNDTFRTSVEDTSSVAPSDTSTPTNPSHTEGFSSPGGDSKESADGDAVEGNVPNARNQSSNPDSMLLPPTPSALSETNTKKSNANSKNTKETGVEKTNPNTSNASKETRLSSLKPNMGGIKSSPTEKELGGVSPTTGGVKNLAKKSLKEGSLPSAEQLGKDATKTAVVAGAQTLGAGNPAVGKVASAVVNSKVGDKTAGAVGGTVGKVAKTGTKVTLVAVMVGLVVLGLVAFQVLTILANLTNGVAGALSASIGGGVDEMCKAASTSASVGSGTTVNLSDPGTRSNISYLYDEFSKQGYSDIAIAGILGNIQQESGFNPEAGNWLGCFGLFQWCGGRRVQLQNWATSQGYDPKSVKGQLGYFLNEMSTWKVENAQPKGGNKSYEYYPRLAALNGQPLKNALNSASSPDEAASWFDDQFERSGDRYCEENPGACPNISATFSGYTNRKKNATNIYNLIQNGEVVKSTVLSLPPLFTIVPLNFLVTRFTNQTSRNQVSAVPTEPDNGESGLSSRNGAEGGLNLPGLTDFPSASPTPTPTPATPNPPVTPTPSTSPTAPTPATPTPTPSLTTPFVPEANAQLTLADLQAQGIDCAQIMGTAYSGGILNYVGTIPIDPKGWALPMANFTVMDTFGTRGGAHKGMDLSSGNRDNEPIVAVRGGVVTFVHKGCPPGVRGDRCGTMPFQGYGNAVLVNHGDGTETLYAHLSTTAVNVGDTVEQLQVLGMQGTSGDSSGHHLHFELHRNGIQINPRSEMAIPNVANGVKL